MKTTILFLILSLTSLVQAQPDSERREQIERLSSLLSENQLSMECNRRLNKEKMEIQFFSFERRLITTMTNTKNRTSWSAQIDILGLKLAAEAGEKTHIRLSPVLKGEDKIPEIHLQLDIQEGSFARIRQERRKKPKVVAYEKGNLNHPFICRFHTQKVR